MKTLKEGHEKIQEICDLLRKETLEPAKEEAKNLIRMAEVKGEEIVQEAEVQADLLIQQARDTIQKEKAVFETALQQAASQAKEALKQEIEQKLFSPDLKSLISGQMREPQTIAKLLDALVKALDKEGLATKITALIPQNIDKEEINTKLIASTLEKLNGKSVAIGSFKGGAKLKVEGNRLTIDLSDEAITEMLIPYLRPDFRKKLFGDRV